jgi:TPR repeat protein
MRVLIWLSVVVALAAPPAAADMAAARSHMRAGDFAAAAAELKRLDDQGDTEAQASLAHMYFTGRGVEQDQEAAIGWFHRAAEGGDLASQVHMGMISAQSGDYEAGFKWLSMAAEAGDADAMTNLAILYLRGLGVAADPKRGLEWFTKAAEAGDPATQAQLGGLYIDGTVGEPDPAAGLKWLRRAADQGYSEAQLRLGTIHAEGKVKPRDPVRAYMWFYRASMMGIEQADADLTALARELTPEQIAEAKRLADEWRPGSS